MRIRERLPMPGPGMSVPARGPLRPSFWRSPLRGPWFTAVFGSVLLVGVTVLFATGLFSYAAYDPRLPGNDTTPHRGILGFYLFTWPTHPYWLYRLNQGVHVGLGLALIPVLLAKLWSVIPKLFENPPVRSLAHLVERCSLLLLVGGAIFEFATGVLNVQYWYVFPGSFYTLHFYGAWVFFAAFAIHTTIRFPRMIRALRSRRWREVLTTDTAHTLPEQADPDHLVSPAPRPATMSRRGAIGLVGAGVVAIVATTAGESIGGGWRRTALLAPRGVDPGRGPNGFQINKTARGGGITADMVGPAWRLELRGPLAPLDLTRADLLALPQHTAHLPIACVEGWSTSDQAWTGVRLRALAAMAGVPAPAYVYVESLQPRGGFRAAALARNQVLDDDSLLALHVNGAELSLDHGYPARVIVPAAPGVHNTKWVTRMTFHA